jgi:hypothetical protein
MKMLKQWDHRTSLDIENERAEADLDNLQCLIFGLTLILVAAGLIVGTWLWM